MALAPPAPLFGRGEALHACPRCQGRALARSRVRGVFGSALKRVLRMRPYRCLDCWHRFLAVSRG